MTDYENNAQAIIDAALESAEPTVLGGAEDNRLYAFVVPEGGTVKVVDVEKELEEFRETPRRKTGTYGVHDADTLVAYLKKHGDPDSEVWADVVSNKITAVLNANHAEDPEDPGAGARWEDHRVVYQVKHTPAWLAWAGNNNKLLNQTDFAEHIEDRAVDIVIPTGAEMLELAQSVEATIGGHFESSKRLSNGERRLEYRENIDAKAGHKGQLEVPDSFALALTPFEGADAFKVTARLRLRINGGDLRIGYKLERPEDILREAFLSVVAAVEEGADQLVFRGVR